MVEESPRDQTAEAGVKGTTTMASLLADEDVHSLLNASFWPAVGQTSEEARSASEGLSFLEATKATVKANSEEVQRTAEIPATVEPPKAPAEEIGLTERNEAPESGVSLQYPVEQNEKNSQVATEPPIPVEDLQNSGEQDDEKSEDTSIPAALVKVPTPTAEENGEKVHGLFEIPSDMEAPKAVGEENDHKLVGGPERFGTMEAQDETNVQKPRGATEIPESSVEENSGDKEVDNVEKTIKDQNCAGANVGWEVVENPSVLGPGPLDGEKAAEDIPTPSKELHTYFMIKIPKLADKNSQTEIRMADLRLKEMVDKRNSINAAIQMRRANRTEVVHKFRAAKEKQKACSEALRQKRDEISPLQGTLRRLRDTGRQARESSRDLPESEQELDKRIAYYEYRIQHESIPLKEEKQLLREIKSLNASREMVCANEALHAEFTESLGKREDIQERLKPLISELESLKAESAIATNAIIEAETELGEMDTALGQVQDQWTAADQARQDAYDNRTALIRQENAQNDEFYQNRRDVQHVRQLAFKKEKKAVEEFCNAQVERVMSLWNTNAEFRAAYVTSNERSTLRRLQTFDGRALAQDEDPPVISGSRNEHLPETQMEFQVGPSVGPSKSQREGASGPSTNDIVLPTAEFERREGAAGSSTHDIVPATVEVRRKGKHVEAPVISEPNGHLPSSNGSPGIAAFSKGREEKAEEDDSGAAAASLKQKRREEEMAKARDAEERKRRAAERLQSKALARAQKEAERQEKEREKRSQKKAAKLSNARQKATSSAEVGSGGSTQEAEAPASLDVVEEQLPPKSGPVSRNPKRPRSHISRAIKTALVSPVTKKSGLHLPVLFWGLGLLVVLAILAVLAIYSL